MCMLVIVYATCVMPEEMLGPLELELKAVLSCLMLLGTKLLSHFSTFFPCFLPSNSDSLYSSGCSETQTHYVDQAAIQLKETYPVLPPKYWD